ncbi:MAG TPA: leucine--tRNA ligase [Candidatus Saccharimonadales bacterium]
MQRYNPKDIESKWRQWWDEQGTYHADLNSDKPKYMAMSMFNYPSGAGIHIGHAMNYTISDVKARFKRQAGYESYHPVGWDAFGLPAENYAIKTGVSPQASMAEIIPSYHKQYKAMGWSNDWEREIATHDPIYYKWTQWIFSEMFRNGLAYQDSRMQWWCEKDKTVLSNEQVIDGKCWRHDGPDDPLVKQKEVKQWFFKITEYADELLEAIDDLDWTEAVKTAQRNWIGRSVGAEIDFAIDGSDEKLKVFTTRPDTLFGATFMVIAPEHDLVDSLTTDEQRSAVNEYVDAAKRRSEVERQAAKDKTGVFAGSYALNPASGEKIPVWIADYVLMGYGTGAIMAVPAHDERDNEFAQKFELPIVRVVQNDAADDACSADEGIMINSGVYDGQSSGEARENIVADLAKDGTATEKVNYKMRDWSVSRQRYWGAPIPVIHCAECGPVLVPDEQLPVVLPEIDDFQSSGDGRSALARATDWLQVDCPKCGGAGERETDTLDTYICSSWYMFRYLDPRNEDQIFDSEIVNKWAPVDFYNGGDHATAHLLYARFVTRFFTKIGIMDNPEPFKQMLFNGKVRASDGSAFSKSKGNGIDPLEIIDSGYGADALRTYLMFAAPLEFDARWDPQGVPGTYRFLNRLWTLVQEYGEATAPNVSDSAAREIRQVTHRMIHKATLDIEENRYNTAIAAIMTAVNDLFKLKVDNLAQHDVWQEALEALVCCVAPFAPHVAEELWHQLGHEDSVHVDHWPIFDESQLVNETVTMAVQVNGKLRGEIQVPTDADEGTIVDTAKADEKVAPHLDGKDIKKTIVVPGKLVNFVAL